MIMVKSNALVVVVLLAGVAPAFADQSTPAPHPNARFGALRPSQHPYKNLFALQTNLSEARGSAQRSIDAPALKPKVVCGMTIIPADPKFDPKMAIPRKSDGTGYMMRTIDPPICTPSR
jgi:hypothetical protein